MARGDDDQPVAKLFESASGIFGEAQVKFAKRRISAARQRGSMRGLPPRPLYTRSRRIYGKVKCEAKEPGSRRMWTLSLTSHCIVRSTQQGEIAVIDRRNIYGDFLLSGIERPSL